MSGRGVHVMAGGLSREAAETVLARAASGWTASAERRLFYPYFWYVLRYRVRTLLGTSAVPVSCLVDARTGLGATSDPFVREHVEPGEEELLLPRCDEAAARRVAKRYTGYVMRRRRKALVATEVDVVERAIVHKPFWIVTCTREVETEFRMLVDGITGTFHPLSSFPRPPRGFPTSPRRDTRRRP